MPQKVSWLPQLRRLTGSFTALSQLLTGTLNVTQTAIPTSKQFGFPLLKRQPKKQGFVIMK